MSFDPISESTLHKVRDAMQQHRLPNHFIDTVNRFYWPMAAWLRTQINSEEPHIVGIQGSQGSGKSTCAHFLKLLLEQEAGLKVAVVSLDDYYLSKDQRTLLAGHIHPLLATRGVPGTHETDLIQTTFDAIRHGQSSSAPVFNKAVDDRVARDEWQTIPAQTDVLIFEGWCVGVPPQSADQLTQPVNKLELEEDSEQYWRRFVNEQLDQQYAALFAQFNTLIALQALSFECVYDWRLLQEQKLIARLKEQGLDSSGTQSPAQIRRFISHYQRLTEHALQTMPERADSILYLNADHSCSDLVLRETNE